MKTTPMNRPSCAIKVTAIESRLLIFVCAVDGRSKASDKKLPLVARTYAIVLPGLPLAPYWPSSTCPTSSMHRPLQE